MNWLYLTLSAAAIFTFWNLAIRVLSLKSKNERAFAFAYNLWGALFGALFFLLLPKSSTQEVNLTAIGVVLLLIAVLFYGGFERLQFIARKAIDASTLAILFRLTPAVTFIVSILFLHEGITVQKLIGMLLVLSASILVVRKSAKIQLNRPFFYAIVCTIFLGLAYVFDKSATRFFPAELYTLLIWILPVIVIYFPYIPFKDIKTEFRVGSWKMTLLAFLNVLGYYIQLQALRLADASQVIPIVSTNAVFVVLGGIFILKETQNIGRKIVAVLLAFIGVILLS